MDQQMSDGNDGFTNNNLFANSQQYNTYDNLSLFPHGSDPNFNDASWGVNASDHLSNPAVSRAQQPASNWQGAHHLSTPSTQSPYNGRSSPYGRSLNQTPVAFAPNAFTAYGNQPGNFSYQQIRQPQQQLQHQHHQQQQYDQSLIAQPATGQNHAVALGDFHTTPSNTGAGAREVLEQDRQRSNFAPPPAYANSTFAAANTFQQARHNVVASPTVRTPSANQQTIVATIPKGAEAGLFVIINFDDLSKVTNSERMGNYLNIGKQTLEWNITRSAIPAYVPRKSRNELRRIAGTNDSALVKIGKKSSKARSLVSASRPMKARPTSTAGSTDNEIRTEQDSSSEDDSSDDDSSYSDDSDVDSPLPAKRPDALKGAIEYDTIKALWRSKRKPVDSESIRKALIDFWEIVKTIRDRWRADVAAVTEAEDKKRTGELLLLKSRVKDQRDMLEAAFKAALKHGHRAIVELLSENTSLLFVCYQFLLDRFKDDDVNGGVSRAVLETMSTFTTLTASKLEKTHIAKILPRYQKKGDAKTQYWLRRIQDNAASATKEAAGKGSNSQNDVKRASTSNSLDLSKPSSPAAKRPLAEASAGTKRAASTSAEGTATKRVATGASQPAQSTTINKPNNIVKKAPLSTDRTSKPAGTAAVAPAVKKTVVAKPSGFFSNLQSASKKPGTSIADKPTVAAGSRPVPAKGTSAPGTAAPKPTFSFAETMANLSKPKEERAAPKVEKAAPPETPEERRKRLRKEERRKLRVTFKRDDELEEVRFFVPHPSEDVDHTSSEMRDVADVGGEGRMFKQQQHRMEIDDDDELAEEAEKLIDFVTPSNIDFSVVDAEERKRNYAPYGGGELQAESAERSIRESSENNTLMVVYTDPNEIPPNPREPTDPYNGADIGELKLFGDPEDKEMYSTRARVKMATRSKRAATSIYATPGMSGFNYGQQQPQAGYGGSTKPMATTAPDISSILAALQQSTSTQPTFVQQQPPPPPPPTASQPGYGQAYMNQPMMQSHHIQPQPQPAIPDLGSIDLAGILATLNGSSNTSTQPGPVTTQPSLADLAAYLQQPPNLGPGGDDEDREDLARMREANPFYKTKVCKFWQEGRCQKGTSCSYLHE